jgi:multiple sugar transport system ATP-binding protein
MTEVVIKNVIKRYGENQAVQGINLEIKDGEFAVLVGPSGCGKSTTLRMIAGLESVTEGDISIGGRRVNDLPPRERNISMVFQNYALYPHMTVRENLGFSLKIAKLEEQKIAEAVNHAAEILGLDELMDRRPAELSGGQRQRVAMGRAIVREPDVFLFDEPLSNLDAKLRTQMRVEIKKLHQHVGNTIIYVTHDQVEAMTLADRIVLMKDGYIVQVGTPLDLFNQPVNTFVATFIGSPPMNLVNAVVQGENAIVLEDGSHLPIPSSAKNRVKDGQKVLLGFRADHLMPKGHAISSEGPTGEFELPINLSEPLGAESILYTEIAGQEVQAKMLNPRPVVSGEVLKFELQLDECHLFDSETTEAIRS